MEVHPGSCLCGSVRFEVRGPIGPVVYCHCSMCRRASGSAFAVNASVQASDFRVLAGEDAISEYRSSPDYVRAFCSRCGSPIYGRPLSFPSLRRVRLGTLEGGREPTPCAAVWTRSATPWYRDSGALEQFEEEPPARYYGFEPPP